MGHVKTMNFPFETNGKLMILGVPILKHFRVRCGGRWKKEVVKSLQGFHKKMILLTCFNLKENVTTLSSKKCVRIQKHTHTAFASTVAVTFGSAWP